MQISKRQLARKKNRIGIIPEFILGCILEGFPQAQKNNCAWVISAHQYPKWKLFGNSSVNNQNTTYFRIF